MRQRARILPCVLRCSNGFAPAALRRFAPRNLASVAGLVKGIERWLMPLVLTELPAAMAEPGNLTATLSIFAEQAIAQKDRLPAGLRKIG